MTNGYALSTALLVLLAQGHVPGATLHVACADNGAGCGRALQAAIDAAPAGTTITLDAGKVYAGSLVVKARPNGDGPRAITITTRGWTDKGAAWTGLVTPADKPRMAVLRGASRTSAALDIENGPGTGHVSLIGLAFEATPPAGQGEIIRIGSGSERDPDNLASHVSIRQVLLQGNREFGQKRGIAANGADIDISQIWCEEIFTPGQDSQCVIGWNGGKRVRIRHSYLAAASENIMIGGGTISAAAMQPDDWLIEDVILHKPLRWKEDGRNRQVKNLLEFKHGRNITARRVLAVTAIVALVSGLGTWLVAPDGTVHIGASGVVFGYGTYLLSRGVFNRNLVELAIGAVVAVVWGGALLGGLLPEEGISWQGHLFGAVGGVGAARLLARDRKRASSS